ncbi:MAG: hypothetical protein C0403_08435 [Desulfobacterium sp.]|nr:hypothetical protein [Desulfobacterium sp.]
MAIPNTIRRRILVACNHRCCRCHRDSPEVDVHHIVAKSQGGRDDIDNLIVFCPNCHRDSHRFKWPASQQRLYRETWIARCASSTPPKKVEPEVKSRICIVVSDFRNFGDRAERFFIGHLYSEEILKVLLEQIDIEDLKFVEVPVKHPKASGLPFQLVPNFDKYDGLFDTKLDIIIHPVRSNHFFDPRKMFDTNPTPMGYFSWVFVAGCISDRPDGYRISARAIIITPEREDTIFIDDSAFVEHAMLDDARKIGLKLADALQEYPWWQIRAEISGIIPQLIRTLLDSTASETDRVRATAIGYFDTLKCVRALASALISDDSAEVRSACAAILSQSVRFKNAKIPALLNALDDPVVEVRYQSISSLIGIVGNHGERLDISYPPDQFNCVERMDEYIARWKIRYQKSQCDRK